jgi:hypothetical protein
MKRETKAINLHSVNWSAIDTPLPLIPKQKLRYVYEKDGKPTSQIDMNKCTKRIIYGDEEFGKPERPNQRTFPGVSASYNGRETIGIIGKLNSGWVETKMNQLKNSADKRDMMIYTELTHPGTYKYEYSNKELLGVYSFYIREYNLNSILANELINEVFYEKFGEKELIVSPPQTVNDVKGKQILRRNKRK